MSTFVDISVDVESAVLSVLEDNSYMTHDAVNDTIEEHLRDNDYVTGDAVSDAVDEALDGKDYQDSSDVDALIQNALSNADYVDRDDVQSIVDDAIDSADMVSEAAMTEAIDAAIADDQTVKDLERRLDLYAQKVDRLTADFDVHVKALEAKVDALSTESMQGLSLLDLLRQAYRIIVGLKLNA